MAEEELEAVLNGTGWDVGGGLWGGTEPQSPVRLGSSVCYVVLAVIFNAEGSILLVQESKPCCRGLWYLPAGRVDPNENLVGALLREVREESGLRCEPVSLLAVEERGHAWVRFVFMARPTGEWVQGVMGGNGVIGGLSLP
ncbi:8-oxo-dGDP phosphatase NUDT18 [Coturnix japonica]|uniref:Nudix hydrolase 18 n=1 Tax=Coturnix japonica TaxID=93934 RepID=A0A8C2TUJ7_COTJA|nr:8-oxo-dGDP phosphatase NUDT18 [Coturnix japonica]